MDKNEVHNAATATTVKGDNPHISVQDKDYFDSIAMSLVVNARGRMCLVHDKPFNASPTWVKYLTKQRKIKLLFDNGLEYVINYILDDKLNKAMLNLDKLFIMQIKDYKPVEGFDTKIIKE